LTSSIVFVSRVRETCVPCLAALSLACAASFLLWPRPAWSQDAPGGFFRIFLKDGTTLTSYGDFAQAGDRVVFSLPIGEFQGQPRLHLATIPTDRVDWPTTERYREATRAAQYATARGDEDFAILSRDVARTLNDIAVTDDPAVRLSLAKEARARLSAWPGDHFGYRAEEIRQILALVDDVISDLRAAAGESRFDISLVADGTPSPSVAPLPPPTLQESIVQALWASRLAGSAAERRSLLEAALGTIEVHAATLPAPWATATRARAERALAHEAGLDAQVARVSGRAVRDATRYASRGDVRGLERLVRDVRRDTADVAAERGDEVQSLLATLDARLDAARRLRLALDQWTLKAGLLRAYERAVSGPVRELARSHDALEDIRTLAGPPGDVLADLDDRFARSAARLAEIVVPADGRPVHAVLTSAAQLAATAVRLRRAAIASGDIGQAWDASAAAAGAMMLLDRARQDLASLARPPQLP
jgi:hypothetical protein